MLYFLRQNPCEFLRCARVLFVTHRKTSVCDFFGFALLLLRLLRKEENAYAQNQTPQRNALSVCNGPTCLFGCDVDRRRSRHLHDRCACLSFKPENRLFDLRASGICHPSRAFYRLLSCDAKMQSGISFVVSHVPFLWGGA